KGAALGRLDAQQKRFLLGGLALWMHERNVAEAPESEILRIFTERLPDVGGRADEARAIVGQIRDRSGVLVERRPGFYGFSHLTFQEYLTAVELARTHQVGSLVRRHGDPWWREVIVLGVGLPGVDSAGVIGNLLEHDEGGASAAAFLAADCVESVV